MGSQKAWIDNLDNPIVLIGFIVFILSGVIVSKIKNSKQQTKGYNSPIINSNGSVNYSIDKSKNNKNL
ncbi:hypothetical protein [Methylomagnum ishizawai]|uniref:hypothetical protein n=1 Tax=Methylomagnum ishizawai TaxID=1760988 RepID=UPI001C33D498|nr:hypothetical protein [Methylomagnum ishizawai]BBL77491.1 hypothetical protein MishRS11D_45890 [Methylomagnum ishizawai]